MVNDRADSPDYTPATGDPGDETARRYRYQWTYAAITCCMLLDDTLDVSEVFCEHHEDVLLRHADDTFSGLQIKTRASDQEPWKASDPAVKRAFAKFVSLEVHFPDRFRAFHFLTNHPLYSAGNGQDLSHVLREIRNAPNLVSVTVPTRRFLQQISRKANCTEDLAFIAMRKTSAIHDLPKFDDVTIRLVDTLTHIWPRAAECSYKDVKRAALALVEECGRASSLAHTEVLPAYIPVVSNPEDAELAARLSGKKIDKTRVLDVLDRGLNETVPLYCDPDKLTEPGTGETALLRQKLDAGGFSAVSLNSAEDLRNRADYFGMVLIQKHGRIDGLQRYGSLRALVLSDAARAFETAMREDRRFGVDMLSELRRSFTRRREDGAQLYGCSNEHLEGFAYSLTSECKVQWSLERPWGVE